MSEALGEQVWRESGLGAPTDIEELQQTLRSMGGAPSNIADSSCGALRSQSVTAALSSVQWFG
ncbi:hypothetical protein J2Z21_009589 [Streptomyces griseochromogenes]|uniref:Uncharacterized protein n=1 Tax=Streptomyces griseochromogenes TaxID=68214 RepID=A0ABS4MA76_9ACTN|nr:hypothetical protein [Streptomyces griseochromogenes]MBP2056570.1 hypothetical protein [Streptomyces griseochromogenes]